MPTASCRRSPTRRRCSTCFTPRSATSITIDADTARPIRLKIVASLDDSVLQGELLIAESAFLTLFPEIEGYRVLFADVASPTPARLDAITRGLEERLDQFGVDVEQSATRLEAFHRVENTYLSTFQSLGGLGLVLGTLGLAAIVARNVFERRRELALLGAAGFTAGDSAHGRPQRTARRGHRWHRHRRRRRAARDRAGADRPRRRRAGAAVRVGRHRPPGGRDLRARRDAIGAQDAAGGVAEIGVVR